MKIAVIGSGISGMSAAWALRHRADVALFEARGRAGGHAHTMDIDYDGRSISVDVGFIVYNALNYPNLIGLLDALGVETKPSDMSFAVSDPEGFEWSSNARGLFAWKRNLVNPRFHRLLRDILRFNDVARAEVDAGQPITQTLGEWLGSRGFDETFRRGYILPMGAAIWSTPEDRMLDYPAQSFFNFFQNHRLMHRERPHWRTVSGGSRRYVDAISADLGSRLRLNTQIERVGKADNGVVVQTSDGAPEVFDHVILACHSDQSARLLDPSFAARKFLLGGVRYRPNNIYLHRDRSLMPKRRAAWASWNVLKQGGSDICLTYWMNRLQGIDDDTPLFVTLNPETPPREDLTFASFEFDHPQFDAAAEAAVRALKGDNGRDGLWLAGAWMGSGFHEDGLKSGLEPALSLGGEVPWTVEGVQIKPVPERAAAPVQRAVSMR